MSSTDGFWEYEVTRAPIVREAKNTTQQTPAGAIVRSVGDLTVALPPASGEGPPWVPVAMAANSDEVFWTWRRQCRSVEW